MSSTIFTTNGSNGTAPLDTTATTTATRIALVPPADATEATPGTPAVTAHHTGDLIARLRDKWGNRLPWFYCYSIPTIDGEKLEDTPLGAALPYLIQRFPVRAHQVHHFYNHQLVAAYRRLVELRSEEERRLLLQCENIERDNAKIDTDLAHDTADDRATLPVIEAALQEAHLDAATHVARVGGGYDPENPSDECVLRPRHLSEEAVAARLQLPWTPSDKDALPHAGFGWALTFLVGAMIGVSLGILCRALIVGDLASRPDALVGFVLGGFAAAALGKYALFLSAREASQRYWLGRPALQWGSFAVFAFLIAGGVLVMDSTVERHGLMAGVRMQQLAARLGSGAQTSAGDETLYLIAALILTWGYVFTHGWAGYLHGRYDACRNRIADERARLAREWEDARRDTAAVQTALDMLARVRDLVRQEGKLHARIADREAHANARRQSVANDLPDEAKRRLQDARDNFEGAQADFNGEWATLRDACEPLGGAGWRLGQWLAHLGRPDRRRSRNSKRAS